MSELLPWTGKVADELAVIHSLNTDAINHEPAMLQINTGNMVVGKPSMGSWLSYGLGSMNENLPTFVVLTSKLLPEGENQPITPRLCGKRISLHHCTPASPCDRKGEPVLFLDDPAGMSRDTRRTLIDSVNAINQMTYEELDDPGEIFSRGSASTRWHFECRLRCRN